MSSSEPINFGRKIKELKRINKKGYAELSAGLKISRERIQQLEENEREPTETERRRFAEFYSLPVEEFEIGPSANRAPVAPRPNPSYNSGFQERPTNYQERPNNFQERPTNYQERPPNNFQERQGGFQERPGNFQRPAAGGGFGGGQPRPAGGGQPRPGSGPAGGPPRPGPGGGGGQAPRPGGPRPDQQRPPRPAGEAGEAREPKEPKSTEPRPVMKYTAEQLGDIESAYLRKQRDLKVPLTFTFLNGKEYTGVVTDFTPFTIHIQDVDTGQEVILRKLAMAYYRKYDAVSTKGAVGEEKPAESKED